MRLLAESELIDDDSDSNAADDHGEANHDEANHDDENHGNDDHGNGAHGDDGHGEHGEGGHGEGGHGEGGHGDHDYLDQHTLMHHVEDGGHFEYSGWLTGGKGVQHLELPQPLKTDQPIIGKENSTILPLDFQLTKYMVLEVAVAIVLVAVFVPLAQRIKSGAAPKGKFWNFWEVLLLFVRDQVARPSIGKHDADKYVPYLWTIFFFVLFCNLFGLIPMLGSPTGALGVTAVLALGTFIVVMGTGFQKLGVVGFFKAQVPHMDLPLPFAIVIKPMIFLIEVIGLFMKHFVLALRLFANMFAGHLVLAVLLAFIGTTWGSALVYFVAPASIFASVGVYLLEIFVAFLQAYIFTFLSALFIGAAAHPH